MTFISVLVEFFLFLSFSLRAEAEERILFVNRGCY